MRFAPMLEQGLLLFVEFVRVPAARRATGIAGSGLALDLDLPALDPVRLQGELAPLPLQMSPHVVLGLEVHQAVGTLGTTRYGHYQVLK